MVAFDVFYYKSKTKLTFCPAPRAGAFLPCPNTTRQGGEPCPAAPPPSPLFILPLPEHVPLSLSPLPASPPFFPHLLSPAQPAGKPAGGAGAKRARAGML